MGATVTALVAVIAELQTQIGRLETELADRFEQHPDAKIIRSLPGLGMTLGARVLGEFGDDPNRYADRQVSQELLRHVTHHPRLRQITRRARPLRPQQASRRRLLPVGLRHPHRQPRRPSASTTNVEPPATPTTAPYEPSPTASSASSTAASDTTPSTTNTPPGATDTNSPLDSYQPWDV